MSFSEQADFSAEHTTEPVLYRQLRGERSAAGSTLGYVRQLGLEYEADRDHKPSLLQLQRMAGVITNPTNEPTFPVGLTNSFYWGQILAYRAQDILSGGEWADTAYTLFSGIMREHFETAQLHFEEPEWDSKIEEYIVPERTHREILQGTADMIMGELEEAEPEFMPPAMESLIVAMTEELSEFPENRWYTILGFRHVTMQAVQTAVNAELKKDEERMTEEERRELAVEIKKEMTERKKLRKQFTNMMDAAEIDDVQGRELIGIDHVREQIMESYADHMIAYGVYDITDEDEVDTFATYLTQTMNRDFVELHDIEAEDFLEIDGTAVFILYDQEGASQIYMLGRGELLKGSVEAVAVAETPSVQAMLRLQERVIETDELNEDPNPLGVVMILKDPVLVNADGEHIQTGDGVVAGVVMANPNMHISKYLL